jgi:tetratricopeptide (TPR) repeat protein
MFRVLRCAILALATMLVLLASLGAENPKLPKSYAVPFGPGPYLPSQADASFPAFLNPADFPPASYCGKCHEGVHAQWRQSAHANSFRAPFYLKNVQMLIDAKGIEYTRHCEGCHNPIALFTGALSKGAPVDRSFDEDGITCSVCHSIEKIQNTSGTGSYVMGRPAVMVDAAGQPVAGLPSYDEILAHPERHRQAVMRPFYRSSEFCAVCHKAAIPKSLNGYRWLRMFAVYDEWQNSSWSKESPLPFYKKDSVSTCQTCHMPSEPAAHDYTPTPGKAASHRWLGANTAIPAVYGYQEQLDRTVQFLKTALKVDLFGIERARPKAELIAPLGAAEVAIRRGETITVDILVQNSGVGHSLVPEQRDFYECWVEFTASDAGGRAVFRSGGLDERGFVDPNAHTYTNRMLSAAGKLLDLHQVWETKLRGYDNTIPSGRSDLVRYRFQIPPDVANPVTLTAKVNYRRFRRGFTNFIFAPDQREFPVVTMASGSFTFNVGAKQPMPPSDSRPAWQRWNNYGIALLGEQQYWAAQEAFKKVILVNPGYGDAYINLALAEYSTLIENKKEAPDGPGNLLLGNEDAKKFDPALQSLEKALQLNPSDYRALYYEGVVLRQMGKLAEATEIQKRVLAVFPRARQALQEAGYVYYLQGNYEAALAEFKNLGSVNPDDLTAHYYLGTIYTKLGMPVEAQREQAAYAGHREDPTVGSVAQEFWRASPGLVNELAPYHVHERVMRQFKPATVGGYLP